MYANAAPNASDWVLIESGGVGMVFRIYFELARSGTRSCFRMFRLYLVMRVRGFNFLRHIREVK